MLLAKVIFKTYEKYINTLPDKAISHSGYFVRDDPGLFASLHPVHNFYNESG